MNLAQRTITSVSWNTMANLSRVVVLFARSVLLARLLPVETFGIYTSAAVTVGLTSSLVGFGLGDAFLHRASETEDENAAASIYFTLVMIFTAIWSVGVVVFTLWFVEGELQLAFLVLLITTAGGFFTSAPRMILVRRVAHRRLSLFQFVDGILTTAVSISLAAMGYTIWALLATNLSTLTLSIVMFYVWRPIWRPRLMWDGARVRYFLHFGSRQILGNVLSSALDKVDDLWTGYFLGQTALGLYSRAYTFATYPRQILGVPINSVATGTYAELKTDRTRLSKAFFRSNALLVRSGFLFAGLLTLLAPEMIRILLGDKWLPMLDIFRLMLIFVLLDPIKLTIASLFSATGNPQIMVWTQLIQLAILAIGLFTLGQWYGTLGVAVSVDVMIVVGVALLLWQSRKFVDYSIRHLFLMPTVSTLLGVLLARLAIEIPGVLGNDWRTGVVKGVTFLLVYGVGLWITERQATLAMLRPALAVLPTPIAKRLSRILRLPPG
ncbi:MAG: oligosaccharide flippase family protein [Caldilineaceae bacterium]|nr:oligosaccharide flippase family protein [Caldilineaceae bacterium]